MNQSIILAVILSFVVWLIPVGIYSHEFQTKMAHMGVPNECLCDGSTKQYSGNQLEDNPVSMKLSRVSFQNGCRGKEENKIFIFSHQYFDITQSNHQIFPPNYFLNFRTFNLYKNVSGSSPDHVPKTKQS